MRGRGLKLAILAGVAALLVCGAAGAGGTLTVGMTAGDLPTTNGNPDQIHDSAPSRHRSLQARYYAGRCIAR